MLCKLLGLAQLGNDNDPRAQLFDFVHSCFSQLSFANLLIKRTNQSHPVVVSILFHIDGLRLEGSLLVVKMTC